MATYKESGVDIDAGNKAVQRVKKLVEGTHVYSRGRVLAGIGGFAAALELPDGNVIGFAVDGVGSKLMLASIMDRHDTVGLDLGAMCFNDLAAIGIEPWVFLDYIAMGKQKPERTFEIIKGMVQGCHLAHAALLGGEMAEMPGIYGESDYDLAGFALGFASSRAALVTGEQICPGMHLYGLLSSGVHSNGFGLIRKVFGLTEERRRSVLRMILDASYPDIGMLGPELLKPTEIYHDRIKQLRARYNITGMAHITGGGLVENPPRMLPGGCALRVNLHSWEVPPIFRLIQERGNVSDDEMRRTFNVGIGMFLISPDKIKEDGIVLIGRVIEGAEKKVFFE